MNGSQHANGDASVHDNLLYSQYGTSPSDQMMELYIIKDRLRVCSIKKKSIAAYMHTITKAALLHDSRPSFFSFTETLHDYTVILSEEQFHELQQHGDFEYSPYPWRIFTVSAGAFGTSKLVGVSKIAKSVIGPLADHAISVLCLSTYQSDYILVQEPFLDEAIKCLGSYFKIYNDDHEKVEDMKRSPQNPPASPKDRAITHPLICPSNKFYITGLHWSRLPNVLQILLEIMFYPSPIDPKSNKEPFFHFSAIQGDISLILDGDALAKFPPDSLYTSTNDESWRMIKIGDNPLGFDVHGVVAQVSEPIATTGISTYYISTYKYGHTLVLDTDIEQVLELLKSRRIVEEDAI